MAGIGDTVAELLARAQAVANAAAEVTERQGGLERVADFGANPGALGMWLHAPEGLPPGAPLVVVLHGCGQTAAAYASGAGWVELADAYGFAVLCPEQTRANNANLCFNWFEPGDTQRGAGEAASIAQMVRHAIAALRADARRVFITGLSAGGAMTTVMLATYPETFYGGAVVAGLPYAAARGVNDALGAMRRIPDLPAGAWGDKVRAAAPAPARWPSVAIWYGDADTTVTPAAAQALVVQWCDVHGAIRSAALPHTKGRHTHVAWLRPDGSVAVELHRIAGLGHGAPISTRGDEACGSAAPWILEAGVSSSREIARSWGLLEVRRSTASPRSAPPSAGNGGAASGSRTSLGPDVAETISKALRGAGLLR